ncbi:lipase member H-A-like [Prorops nasuta]|uniref:lipase member H-A-like n=1 Tax=Prorops nasuta TaxID=863751 RepID=UPI0034CFFB5C
MKLLHCLFFISLYLASNCVFNTKAAFLDVVETIIGATDDGIAGKVNIVFFRGKPSNPSKVSFLIEEVDHVKRYLNLKKGLILYIHGYMEGSESESSQIMSKVFLERGDCNVAVLDWSKLSHDLYPLVVLRSRPIARSASRALDKLIEFGLDSSKVHVIGHSAGGHIADYISKFSKNKKVRYTGLDLAGPLYISKLPRGSDEPFFDVLHTDSGVYGTIMNVGTVDFYANGGTRPQPGCALLDFGLCNHQASWRYYFEIVRTGKGFLATKCSDYVNYTFNHCDDNDRVWYTYNLPRNISGTYYFLTPS